MEGRLHYYKGHFAETGERDQGDIDVFERLFEAAGLNWSDYSTVDEWSGLGSDYVMAEYVVDGGKAEIAFKEPQEANSEARALAEKHFREWAGTNAYQVTFVPYPIER